MRSSDGDSFVELDVGVGELNFEEATGSVRFGGLREIGGKRSQISSKGIAKGRKVQNSQNHWREA